MGVNDEDIVLRGTKEEVESGNLEDAQAEFLRTLGSEFTGLTNFSKRELKAISIIYPVEPLRVFLKFQLLNRKHIKGTHGNRIEKLTKHFSNISDKGIIAKLLGRRSDNAIF